MVGDLYLYWVPIPTLFEIGLWLTAGFVLFRKAGNTIAESLVYAIVGTMMALSFIDQLVLRLNLPGLFWFLEIPVFISAVVMVGLNRKVPAGDIRSVFRLAGMFPITSGLLVVFFLFLLATALMFQPLRIEAIPHITASFVSPYGDHGGIVAVSSRYATIWGSGIFSFLSYLAIGLATYALARRYAWPPTAYTVALVALSYPRMVYLAVTPNNEIMAAAVGVFCLLALYRVVEWPNIRDLLFMSLGLAFLATGGKADLAAAAVLLLLTLLVGYRRHGSQVWFSMIGKNRRAVLVGLVPLVMFLIGFDLSTGEPLGLMDKGYGWITPFQYNPDALIGAGANILRYLVEGFHLTEPVDRLLSWSVGFSPLDALDGLYGAMIQPLVHGRGAVEPFYLDWRPRPELSWFGPLAFILVLPSLLYALVRGNRRLKAVVVAMLGYVYIVALVVAWESGNARYFTLFFACTTFCLAFFLPPWRFSWRGKRRLHLVCLLLMLYSALTCTNMYTLFY